MFSLETGITGRLYLLPAPAITCSVWVEGDSDHHSARAYLVLGWRLLSLRKSLWHKLMHCFEVRGIIRFALHHLEHSRDRISQVGIWRKLTSTVFFSHHCGIAESYTANGKCPRTLKDDLRLCKLPRKTGKRNSGKTLRWDAETWKLDREYSYGHCLSSRVLCWIQVPLFLQRRGGRLTRCHPKILLPSVWKHGALRSFLCDQRMPRSTWIDHMVIPKKVSYPGLLWTDPWRKPSLPWDPAL